MHKYFFALGTNHTLSKIDIVNSLLVKGVDFEILEASEEILIVETTTELDLPKLINELGSAAKIGEIFNVYEKEEWPGNFLKDNLEEKLEGEAFGISVYGAGGKFKELNDVFYSVRKISETIKNLKNLREVREQGRILSTVSVDKNELLKNGFELVISAGTKGIYVGKTIAIQDYEGYSSRDYGRPERDTKSGMIPPKLAKMMINLCSKSKEETILDPFCGSGTFLQEMMMLGYKDIIGADLEDRAIEDSRRNMEWLKGRFFANSQNDTQVKLIKSDARTLSTKIPYKSISAIVTEPFLGSSNVRYLYPDEIKKELAKVEELYLSSFREFTKLLYDGAVVTVIFPIYRFKNQFFKLEILNKLKALGFYKRKFIEKRVPGDELLKLQITERDSVVFFRPGQSVSREIFVFQKA